MPMNANGEPSTPTREMLRQYLAGLPPPPEDWQILMSIDRYLELIMDFRKTELSRIRRRVKHGKQKTMTSRFLEDIDRRILECARTLCEKSQEHSLETGETK